MPLDSETMSARNDTETMWRAVVENDRAADGQFVYAVASTGVYCRPSCRSRRPNRENVRFFPVWVAAERAGYRPCRKCHPRDLVQADAKTELVARACSHVEATETPPGTLALAEALGVAPGRLQRAFRDILGITPKAYLATRRDNAFRAALRSESTVTEAVYAAGFEAPSRAYEKSGARFGMSPGAYAKGGTGQAITYALADSPLGRMLVGATDRGLCAVQFSNSDDMLVAELRREFPGARLQEGDAGMRELVSQVAETLKNGAPPTSLALDIRATAFQRRVWDALQAIPPGETRTYGEIARSIGAPRAARAVGAACSQNRLAVVIPCHRAVRGDGGLGGYRWGLERKERLLEAERRESGSRGDK